MADTGNHTIRCVTPAGVVSTVAGLPGVWGNADGTNRAARFFQPQGITVDGQGNLFVLDSGNHTVRMIVPAGTNSVVYTVAGQADFGGSANGTGGGAQFYYPGGIAVNGSGSFAVADSGNNTLRAGAAPVARFDRIIALANGSVQLNMSGAPNASYTLQTSANLSAWTTLATLPSGTGSFQYHRFLRHHHWCALLPAQVRAVTDAGWFRHVCASCVICRVLVCCIDGNPIKSDR